MNQIHMSPTLIQHAYRTYKWAPYVLILLVYTTQPGLNFVIIVILLQYFVMFAIQLWYVYQGMVICFSYNGLLNDYNFLSPRFQLLKGLICLQFPVTWTLFHASRKLIRIYIIQFDMAINSYSETSAEGINVFKMRSKMSVRKSNIKNCIA